MKFEKLKNDFLDFLFPKECIKCSKVGSYLCKHCKQIEVQFVEQQFCHVCRFPRNKGDKIHESCSKYTALQSVFVCMRYGKLVERILEEVKYHLYFDYNSLIVDLILEVLDCEFIKNSILIPVPLHKKKFKKRGFNQAELIASELLKRVGEKINTKVYTILQRIRNTKTQVGMSKEERVRNLKEVFVVIDDFRTKMIPKDKKIILVDDVMTTGTTLEECARALRKYGFTNIHALVFARG